MPSFTERKAGSGRDHVADAAGEDLARYAKLYNFPDFVKRADMEQTFKPERLSVTVYADPVRRQFPCHTAASTWLSALYFTEKRAEFHPKDQAAIQARLDHYVRFWKIASPVQAMLKKHAGYVKEAEADLPDSSYAYVYCDPATGRKERHLCLRNAQEVKTAAEYIYTYRDRFSFKDRHAMAKRVLEKAARYGASLSGRREFLEKQAGMGACDPASVVRMLKDRAKFADLPALKEQLCKLAATIEGSPKQALHPDNLVSLAETVDGLDRGLRLTGKYSESVPRPEDVIFATVFSKTAEEVASLVSTTSGRAYRKEDFGKLALDDLKSLFGNALADEVRQGVDRVDIEKLAEIVPTLPRGDAVLFDQLMQEANIKPAVVKGASVKQGFSKVDYLKFAKDYEPAKK